MPANVRTQIRQAKPFSTPEAEAFVTMWRASHELETELADTLREFKLTRPQFNVLRILRGAGGRGLPSGASDERTIAAWWPSSCRLRDERWSIHSTEPVRDLHIAQFRHFSRAELESLIALLEKARDRSDRV
jgi:hypothetical protein